MKKSLISLSIVLSSLFLLTGCEESPATAAKRKNPEISIVGIIDGCEVKFVDRGYNLNSFYIAKCDNTVTTTRNWTEREGKTDVAKRSTVIQQQINELSKEKAKLEAIEVAKGKLSSTELEALGLK
jgi:hypothetical protein